MSDADFVRILSDSGRDPHGRFASSPGNRGRPLGAVAKASRNLLAQVKALGPQAIEKLSAAVEAGERWAIEVTLSHCLPRNRAIEFEGTTPEDVAEALRAGDISAAEAKDISTALVKLGELGELAEMRERIAALERMIAANDPR